MSYIENLFSVKEKVVFITGAGSGLGQHCAALFSKLGSNVAYSDINLQSLEETELLLENKQQHLKLQLDIREESKVQDAIAKTIKKFGHVDILINSAAVIDYAPWTEVTTAIWNKTYETDLLGSWLVSKAVATTMVKQKIKGTIINISSSLYCRTQKDLIPYNSIKAAVAHMTRSLGLELTPYNIRVNAIAPGFMKTKMVADFLQTADGKRAIKSVPLQRAADLKEIEGLILLLASDASSYMSGSIIKMDGGLAFNHIEIPHD